MADKPKVKLKDTANPWAHIQSAEDAKKKKAPAKPSPSWYSRVGTYAQGTAKKLWPSVFK